MLFSIAGSDDLTMFEIQGAAKIITESIDPNAKVIFGTVRDDKLRKNEIKVTVIAAGFPEGVQTSKKTLFHPIDVDLKEDKKGKIYNTIGSAIGVTQSKDAKVAVHPPAVEEKKEVKPVVEDDDDWSAVPAFLRRSKSK